MRLGERGEGRGVLGNLGIRLGAEGLEVRPIAFSDDGHDALLQLVDEPAAPHVGCFSADVSIGILRKRLPVAA